MPSRMERYYDSSDKTVTRTKRNRSLYDEIYEEKEYTNVEGIVKTPATENIDIEKIREMMRKYEDGEKVRTKRIDKTPKIEEIMEEDTPKNYDINDVLNKAMAEKKDDETTYHSLKNTEYNILKNLKINKPKVEEKEEVIQQETTPVIEKQEPVVEQPQTSAPSYIAPIDTTSFPVLSTNVGTVSHYGHDCYGCTSGKTASGYYIGDGRIYYNDPVFGSVRIVAAGSEYPLGSILRLTNIGDAPMLSS